MKWIAGILLCMACALVLAGCSEKAGSEVEKPESTARPQASENAVPSERADSVPVSEVPQPGSGAEITDPAASQVPVEFIFTYTEEQLARRDKTALDEFDEACYADLFTQVAAAYSKGLLPLTDASLNDGRFMQPVPEGAVFPDEPVRYDQLTFVGISEDRQGSIYSLPLGDGHEMTLAIYPVNEEVTAQYVADVTFG